MVIKPISQTACAKDLLMLHLAPSMYSRSLHVCALFAVVLAKDKKKKGGGGENPLRWQKDKLPAG